MRIKISPAGNDAASPFRAARDRGFTLLELVVVLVIMGIVLGVTIPRFGSMLGGGGSSRFSKSLAAYLRGARELSLIRGSPVVVAIDPDGARIVCRDLRSDEQLLSPLTPPEIVHVELEFHNSPLQEAVVFYPLGNATGGRFLLEVEGESARAVDVEAISGEVRIE